MVAVATACSVLVGCGGGDKPAVCSDVDALHASVDNLKDVEASQSGLTELKADLSQVGSDVSRLRSDSQQQYAQEIAAVDQAYQTLASDFSQATQAPSAAGIAQVATDLQALGTSLTGLDDAVQSTC
jgi:hypothetical protein